MPLLQKKPDIDTRYPGFPDIVAGARPEEEGRMMKKIINGRLYDTETARRIASYDSTPDPHDPSHIKETLYCKRNMECFLHCVGGSSTHYARSTGPNAWSSGEKIVPLSYDAAMEWARKHMDMESYAHEFGPVSEEGPRVTICISVPGPTAEKAKKLAATRGVTVSALIAGLIDANWE